MLSFVIGEKRRLPESEPKESFSGRFARIAGNNVCDLPSGKHLHSHGKSVSLIGKSTMT